MIKYQYRVTIEMNITNILLFLMINLNRCWEKISNAGMPSSLSRLVKYQMPEQRSMIRTCSGIKFPSREKIS